VAVAQAATEVPLAATINTASTDLTPSSAADASAPTPAVDALAQSQAPAYENLNSPVDLLASYYNAINRKEYQRAYGYWQTAPTSYQNFVNGFSDTTAAQLIVQPPTFVGGAAGSLYTQVPTALVAKHTDGSTHTYAGCFVTRKSNIQADVWHIYSAQLKEVPNNTSIPNQLAQACPS